MLMTAPASDPGTVAALAGTGPRVNNNDCNTVRVDVDSNPTTFDSSRADLKLPSNGNVLFAGLYW